MEILDVCVQLRFAPTSLRARLAINMPRHQMRRGLQAKSKLSKLVPSKPGGSKKSKPARPAAPSTSTSTAEPVAGPSVSHEARDALPRSAKVPDLERQLKLTKTSTASLGKYDNRLKGESDREKGIRRKFQDNSAVDATVEREKNLAILNGLDSEVKVQKRKEGKSETSDLVNARRAIRAASKGKGSANLAGQEAKSSKFTKKAGPGLQKMQNKSPKGKGKSSGKGGKAGQTGKAKSSLQKGKRKGK